MEAKSNCKGIWICELWLFISYFKFCDYFTLCNITQKNLSLIDCLPSVYFYGRVLSVLDFGEGYFIFRERNSENSDVSQVFLCRQLSL